ncbi:hypothetical protein ABZV34_26725 [Streptomyces sp. NPDC005195]|uniref:hypothetical protein n=1 Tax=Streptomyces sp. NPDC005195 TaxID=3154561 RepID=UPI0033A9924B
MVSTSAKWPSSSQVRPLTDTTGGADPTHFVYDTAGNLLTRTPVSGHGQSMTWTIN